MFEKAMDASVAFNTGEPIFEDPLFKKYMERRLEELSEYCNRFYNRTDVTTENIYEALLEGMRHHSAQLRFPSIVGRTVKPCPIAWRKHNYITFAKSMPLMLHSSL